MFELKRGTKLDGKENPRSKIITWLRSRDCDEIYDDPEIIQRRSIQEKIEPTLLIRLFSTDSWSRFLEVIIHLQKAEIRKDPYAGLKWKLNYESDCFSSCKGGFCPSYCGPHGFCCSGDETGFLIDPLMNLHPMYS